MIELEGDKGDSKRENGNPNSFGFRIGILKRWKGS
jgi:hypothetical protein